MIKFNEQNLEVLTFAQCLDPAMKVRSQIEADQYLKDYANYILEDINSDPFKDKDADPYEIARTNLGYWAAYFGASTRFRVEKFFKCEHPVFGKVYKLGVPTPAEAYDCGRLKITLEELRKNG